eukprot:jgi/Hompol1/4323/HPOL_007046-RA
MTVENRERVVVPIQATYIAIEALKQAGVEVIVAAFDADDLIPVIAREREAHVIANDSDFFLYNVTSFIHFSSVYNLPINEVAHDPAAACVKLNDPFLASNRYHLASALGISPTYVPLIAVLAGYDIPVAPQVERLFSLMKLDLNSKKWPIILSLLKPIKDLPVEAGLTALSSRLSSSQSLRSMLVAEFKKAMDQFNCVSEIEKAPTTAPVGDVIDIALLNKNVSDGIILPRIHDMVMSKVFICSPIVEDDLQSLG